MSNCLPSRQICIFTDLKYQAAHNHVIWFLIEHRSRHERVGVFKFRQSIRDVQLFAVPPDLHFYIISSPFLSRREILEQQWTKFGIDVVPLNVQIESIDFENHVQRFQDLCPAIGPLRNVNDHYATGIARNLQPRECGRIFGLLPKEMEVAETVIISLFMGLEYRLNKRSRNS